MSRWAAAFHAFKAADTVDTVDTVVPPSGAPPHCVNSVNSVTQGVEPDCGAGQPAGQPAAISDSPVPADCVAVEPDADMVAMMAEAMAANPAHRITDHGKAMHYFRAQAIRRLALTNDPMVRGLLLGWEQHSQRAGGGGRDAMPAQPDATSR
jgi:hypothetical protein